MLRQVFALWLNSHGPSCHPYSCPFFLCLIPPLPPFALPFHSLPLPVPLSPSQHSFPSPSRLPCSLSSPPSFLPDRQSPPSPLYPSPLTRPTTTSPPHSPPRRFPPLPEPEPKGNVTGLHGSAVAAPALSRLVLPAALLGFSAVCLTPARAARSGLSRGLSSFARCADAGRMRGGCRLNVDAAVPFLAPSHLLPCFFTSQFFHSLLTPFPVPSPHPHPLPLRSSVHNTPTCQSQRVYPLEGVGATPGGTEVGA